MYKPLVLLTNRKVENKYLHKNKKTYVKNTIKKLKQVSNKYLSIKKFINKSEVSASNM